jgi:adhesin transport system membrane fusion protein
MSHLTLMYAPPLLRRAAMIFFWMTMLMVVAASLAPWRQSARGEGQVVAFRPHEREQSIDAPIDGRIVEWFVIEGARVEAGQDLVEIVDVDPLYADRLELTREASLERLSAAEARIGAIDDEIVATETARQRRNEAAALRVDMARQSLLAAEQTTVAARAALFAATQNETRVRSLLLEKLVSERDVELAELARKNADAEVAKAEARVAEARAAIDGAEAERLRTDADAIASIAKARAEGKRANADRASAGAEVIRADSDIARQATRRVKAPVAGTVLRVAGQQGGRIVKSGDLLCVIVPDTDDIAAELFVDANDAPLIEVGQKVRIQIEGWPAVQVAGWPQVSVGTFGAVVAFADPQGREDGRVRVVVRPDPDDAPWPTAPFLRQGVRAVGFVLLGEVTVGYEFWRRLNGFPVDREKPAAAREKTDSSTSQATKR